MLIHLDKVIELVTEKKGTLGSKHWESQPYILLTFKKKMIATRHLTIKVSGRVGFFTIGLGSEIWSHH